MPFEEKKRFVSYALWVCSVEHLIYDAVCNFVIDTL